MVRVTFSLDEPTVAEIRRTAARLRKPQSQIVREAVADYAARADRLSETERIRMLAILHRLRALSPRAEARRQLMPNCAPCGSRAGRGAPAADVVIIHLDTSVLIGALTGPRGSLDRLIHVTDEGHLLGFSTIVRYEWLRGPRTAVELGAQEDLLPRDQAVPFGVAEAAAAARLSAGMKRGRGRDVDLAIAASALVQGAVLWTLNPADFADLPGVRLF